MICKRSGVEFGTWKKQNAELDKTKCRDTLLILTI